MSGRREREGGRGEVYVASLKGESRAQAMLRDFGDVTCADPNVYDVSVIVVR